MTIIPIRPDREQYPSRTEAPDVTTEKASRRTFGRRIPSRRTFGFRLPKSRRTFRPRTFGRRTFHMYRGG